MKAELNHAILPDGALLITCSSHEHRCLGVIKFLDRWRPTTALLFHYDDDNPTRELNHLQMERALQRAGIEVVPLGFTESSAVRSMRQNSEQLKKVLTRFQNNPIVVDISVFTKRHLLLLLRWLDDAGVWNRVMAVYSEPDEYDVSRHVPLSFGLASFHQIPGLPAVPDLSRPVHLVLFLGYEGDRALAVYDRVQPMRTTLVVADPPFKASWRGRTEELNADLLKFASDAALIRSDGLDPDVTTGLLEALLVSPHDRRDYANLIAPLGTKAQTLGVYSFVRQSPRPPAIVYASPLRHNHEFFSHGIGTTWLLKGSTL